MEIEQIRQIGTIGRLTFQEGDVLKVEMENNGTKNVYFGKFIGFDIKKGLRFYWHGSVTKRLIFRHHTLHLEGLFKIDYDNITKINKLKK